MSGQEDFAPLLEALVTVVGVVDVISLFACIFNRKNAKELSLDINNNDVSSHMRVRGKTPISDLARSIPHVVVDGIAPSENDDVIESLLLKVNDLEAKVSELEIRSRGSSMERFVDVERYRRSRSPSPYPHVSGSGAKDEDSSYDDERNSSSTESRAGSVRHPSKLITRDDEFRKTKRSSQISHESREEELMEFSRLERQESENMDGFVPITYDGQEDSHYRHGISPIQEVPSCPIHGEIERSPEPGLSSMADKPWGDIKKDAGDIRKHQKEDQLRRSKSIDEQPRDEERADEESGIEEKKTSIEGVDVNEKFIKMEQNVLQQSAKLLVKQAHVSSEEQNEETVSDFEVIQIPVVEIVNQPTNVRDSLTKINLVSSQIDVRQNVSPAQLSTGQSSTANDVAVRSTTPEPDVSMDNSVVIITTDDVKSEIDMEIFGSPPLEGLRRSKRCVDSLDRSASRSSSRLSQSKKNKSPSVASQEDYKEWFDKFDNHITPNLTVPDNDDDEFDSDLEEDFLMHVDDGNLNGAEICKIEDDIDERNVSVSVTVNLKKSPVKDCFPCAEFQQDQKVYKTKAEEFLELERFRENQTRRLSIVPSSEEQQKNYVSILHPEEFPKKTETVEKQHHQHHDHLHGYHEWMKKIVDHHSSHLAMNDSDSDSDVSLDEIRMLPLFHDEKFKK